MGKFSLLIRLSKKLTAPARRGGMHLNSTTQLVELEDPCFKLACVSDNHNTQGEEGQKRGLLITAYKKEQLY